MPERFQELIKELTAEFEKQIAETNALRESLWQKQRLQQAWSQEAASQPHEPQKGAVVTPVIQLNVTEPSTQPTSVRQISEETAPSPLGEETKLKSDGDIDPTAEKTVTISEPPSQPKRRKSTVAEFQRQKHWYIINPDRSVFVSRWDVVTIVALTYVALVTPVTVGLMEPTVDFGFVIGLLVDCIFLFDMILQFFLMYPVQKARGVEMESRPQQIWLHYLRTWFPIDFLTILPFDLLSVSLDSTELSQMKSIKIIRLFRLLKLIRILKSSRVFLRLEISWSIPYQQFALIKFLVILILVCHWEACVWAMTLTMTPATEPRWIDSLSDLESHLPAGDMSKDSPLQLYIASFYFCSYTMTSVGYGDIGPKNLLERVTCILIILVSGLCWAYILGEVCGIVGDMNAEAQSFRKKMDNLNYMMSDRSLPQMMRQRLRSYFLASKDSQKHGTQKQLLEGMSPALQGEVSMALNMVWMGKVPFLAGFLEEAQEIMNGPMTTLADSYRACVSDVARILETVSFAQGEIFGENQVLHILYKGLAAMNGRVMKTGDLWGDDFLLSDTTLQKRPKATALTYVEIIIMTRESLMQVVEKHRLMCPDLANRARYNIVHLAARRGILAYAKKQREMMKEQEALRRLGQAESPQAEKPYHERPKEFKSFAPVQELPNQIGTP
mmetsp:Transcript_15484/g.27159  ORF Transcript_15484/g.27159 Transcript_15484/m.27159 type:complete len:669 (+) Transcript_15484:71-2077(+)